MKVASVVEDDEVQGRKESDPSLIFWQADICLRFE